MNRRTIVKTMLMGAALGSAWSLRAAEQPAADLALKDLQGGRRDIAHWSGQIRLVNFWATWCGPCREEVPLLEEAHRRYRDRDFTVIGVALDTARAVSSFKARFGITYPLLVAGSELGLKMMNEYGNGSGAVPYSVLLSPKGNILDAHLGAFNEAGLHELLERYLNKSPNKDDKPHLPQTQLTRSPQGVEPQTPETSAM